MQRVLFSKAIILQTVYFKLRFSLIYRDVKLPISIRGVKVACFYSAIGIQIHTPSKQTLFMKAKKIRRKKMESRLNIY